MAKILLVLMSALAFSLTACADSPESPVAPKDNPAPDGGAVGGQGDGEEEVVTALAIKYEGKSRIQGDCNLYIALDEDGHDHESDHDHDHAESFLIKMDYATSDGHRPSASKGNFYQQLNDSEGTLVEVDPEVPGSMLTFVSMAMADGSEVEPESLNQIFGFIGTKALEHAFRVEYKLGVEFHDYEESLEAVLEDENTFAAHQSDLDMVDVVVMDLLHNNDHYHSPTCRDFRPVAVVETEFDMEGHDHDHGGDDYDHDHDHDH